MIKCGQCGKDTSYEDSWNWTELGVTTSFCSRECLNKWVIANRDEEVTLSATYKIPDEE